MRIFLTGATGFIGTALVPELIHAGHHVLGLTRSDVGAAALQAAGAQPHHGTLEDPRTLTAGAAQADAVIHAAFDHNFANFMANIEKERLAIEALGAGLRGSDCPLLITSGVGLGAAEPGKPATEDVTNLDHPNPRIVSERAGQALADAGANVSYMRLPQVHDTHKQGLITYLISLAREKGKVAYLGEGLNRFAAVPLQDCVRAYRLAIEKAAPNARYNAVAEEGVSARDIAEALGRGMNLPVVSLKPEETADYFGWMAMFAGLDLSASSTLTQQRLNWHPTGPSLLADLDAMHYPQA